MSMHLRSHNGTDRLTPLAKSAPHSDLIEGPRVFPSSRRESNTSPVLHPRSPRLDQRPPVTESRSPVDFPNSALARRPRSKSPPKTSLGYESYSADAQRAAMYAGELQCDITAREARLHMLRIEVAAREQEIEELTVRNRDAALRLVEASGSMDTMSVKVERVAENRSGVMKASARTSGIHAEMLKRWLAKMEWDLQEKDEEIAKLRAVTTNDFGIVRHQKGEYDTFIHDHWGQEQKAALLQEEERRAQRHFAIDKWAVNVKAKIDKESADVAIRRQRRAFVDKLLQVNETNQGLIGFIVRMQDKCRELADEIEATRRKHDALVVDERVSTSTAKLGQDCIADVVMNEQAEMADLQQQLQKGYNRIQGSRAKAMEYDKREISLIHGQRELMSLTACLREVKRTLTDPSMANNDDAVDIAVTELVESLQDYGMAVPPLLRIGPSEYLVGGELVQCTMRGGNLFVRPSASTAIRGMPTVLSPRSGKSTSNPVLERVTYSSATTTITDMIPIGEFLRSRALQAPRTSPISEPLARRSSMSRRGPITPALPTFATPVVAPQEVAKGLAGLVSPMMIGAHSPLIV